MVIAEAFPFKGHVRRLATCVVIGVVGSLANIAFATLACAENPADHIFAGGSLIGGVDPHGDSWQSIRHSLEQFLHPEFVLRLLISLTLSVVCAWIVAWHPRSARFQSLFNLEERKTLVLLGMVGAIVGELSGISQTLAFVIFGIGALLRFRTVLDNPKLTGKAIIVVVIGLACGLGSWVMAVLVTAYSWALIFWLDSRVACRLRMRLPREIDPEPVFGTVQSLLISRGCRLESTRVDKNRGLLVFLMQIPAQLDLTQLRTELRATLPEAVNSRIQFNLI